MSLKTLHQVIIFAGIAISLVFSAFCFLDPTVKGQLFLRKTRRLIL